MFSRLGHLLKHPLLNFIFGLWIVISLRFVQPVKVLPRVSNFSPSVTRSRLSQPEKDSPSMAIIFGRFNSLRSLRLFKPFSYINWREGGKFIFSIGPEKRKAIHSIFSSCEPSGTSISRRFGQRSNWYIAITFCVRGILTFFK